MENKGTQFVICFKKKTKITCYIVWYKSQFGKTKTEYGTLSFFLKHWYPLYKEVFNVSVHPGQVMQVSTIYIY